MIVGLVIGGGVAWWFSAHAANGSLIGLLPSAEVLALTALGALAVGWLVATIAPGFVAGVALGSMPGVIYASVILDRIDHARASSLLGLVVVQLALGVGCALHGYKVPPAKRHHRWPARPPRAIRH